MITEVGWRRILFASIGLVILVALIIAFIVIPSVRIDTFPQATPEKAIPAFWINVIIHMLVIAILIYSVLFGVRVGHLKNGFLVAAGVMLILLSLVISDAAFAFSGHPDMHSTTIFIFMCVGLDFIAGILSFIARYFRGHLKPIN